jgi:hypothetical protein
MVDPGADSRGRRAVILPGVLLRCSGPSPDGSGGRLRTLPRMKDGRSAMKLRLLYSALLVVVVLVLVTGTEFET